MKVSFPFGEGRLEEKRPFRMTVPRLKIIRVFLEHPNSEFTGADLMKITKIPSGTLYPILLSFEEYGWLESHWEGGDPKELARPRKRFYLLTRDGLMQARKSYEDASMDIFEPGLLVA